VEIELKFQVPEAARERVRRAVATSGAQVTPLRAVYADTDDDRLARAGLALRLRREGRRWVQTLKGRGDGLMQRLEHEVVLPAQRGTPALDPLRHAGSEAGQALDAALRGAEPKPLYRTEIRRTHRVIRAHGARIEIAFDEGRILAAADGRSVAVCELEFELLSGPPSALLAVAERWVQRHGLWLDVRTKSERGFRLARDVARVPAVRALPADSVADAKASKAFARMPPGAAFARLVQQVLQHLLPNQAECAGGSDSAEHLHQWRVAARRLRTVLRLMADWSGQADAAAGLEARWAVAFDATSAQRDDDAMAATLWPLIDAAGGPPGARDAGDPGQGAADSGAAMRDPGLTVLVLQTWSAALAAGEPAAVPPEAPAPGGGEAGPIPVVSLRPLGAELLDTQWRRVVRGCKHFEDLSVPQQHRLRKRLKRLRYATELLQPLWPAARVQAFLDPLRAALQALGEWQDLQMAAARLAGRQDPDSRTWFALGWIAGRHEQVLQRAVKALRAWRRARRPWR